MNGNETLSPETTPSVPASARRLPWWVIALSFGAVIALLVLVFLGMQRSMSGPITVGQQVPQISMTTFDGDVLRTTDMAGKVIVLNFWASWCKPCEQEAAELEEAWQKYKPGGQVVFLGLAYVDTEPKSRGYLQKFKITYPNGPDLRTQVSQMFRIRGVPETYIIGRDGKLANVKIGPFESTAEITQIIDSLLK